MLLSFSFHLYTKKKRKNSEKLKPIKKPYYKCKKKRKEVVIMKESKENKNAEKEIVKTVRKVCQNARGSALSSYIEAAAHIQEAERLIKDIAPEAAVLDTARNNEEVGIEVTCSLMATEYTKMRLRMLAKAIRNEKAE
jgi:ribosome-binding protein aMBF1 (putative translation factor)